MENVVTLSITCDLFYVMNSMDDLAKPYGKCDSCLMFYHIQTLRKNGNPTYEKEEDIKRLRENVN